MATSRYPCPRCHDYVHFIDGHYMKVFHRDGTYTLYHAACWRDEKIAKEEHRRRIEAYNRARASLTVGTPSYSPVKAEFTIEKEF